MSQQGVGAVGLLPGQIQVVPAEVAVGGYLAVDGTAQVQIPDDGGGTQVKDLADGLGQLLIGDLAGAEGVHTHGDGLSHADGVGQLDLAALG